MLTENSTSTSSRASWSSSNLLRRVSRYSSASWWYSASVMSAAATLTGEGSDSLGLPSLSGRMAMLRVEVVEMERRPTEGRAMALTETRATRLACAPRQAARVSLVRFVGRIILEEVWLDREMVID